MCTALEKQIGGNTKTAAPNHSRKDVEVLQGW